MAVPDELEIYDLIARAAVLGMRVSLPGIVRAVDRAGGRVDVEPAVRARRADPEADPEGYPIIPDVPVAVIGTGLLAITLAINEGDTGLLVFGDESPAGWLASGEVSDPPTGDTHGLSGAVFVPALQPDAQRPAIPEQGMVVGYRTGNSSLTFDEGTATLAADSEVLLGSPAADDPVVRLSDLQALVDGFLNGVPAPMDGGAAFKLSVETNWTAAGVPSGSDKVKAE